MFTCLNPGAIGLTIPFDEALTLARDAGFEGLDLNTPELAQRVEATSLQAIRDQFHAARVRPGGWSPPFDFRAEDAVYRAGLEALPRYATIAQALGGVWCQTWIWPVSDDLDYDANMAFHVERLRPLAQLLADHGCRLGLEFVGPKTLRDGHRYPFISTIAGALELGERIGTGNTGLLLDSWHWYTSHATVADIERLTAEQVVYVHVNDAPPDRATDAQLDDQRLLPGASGVIDGAGFLRALDRIGYDGPVVVEPFNAALNTLPAPERVRATKASLDAIWRLHV